MKKKPFFEEDLPLQNSMNLEQFCSSRVKNFKFLSPELEKPKEETSKIVEPKQEISLNTSVFFNNYDQFSQLSLLENQPKQTFHRVNYWEDFGNNITLFIFKDNSRETKDASTYK